MLDMKIERQRFGTTLQEFNGAEVNNTYLVDDKGEIWSVWQKLPNLPIMTLRNFERPGETFPDTLTISFVEGYGTVLHTVGPTKTLSPITFHVVGEREIIPKYRDYFIIVRCEKLQREWVIGPFLQPRVGNETNVWLQAVQDEEEFAYTMDFQLSIITGYLANKNSTEAVYLAPDDFIEMLISELPKE